MSGAPEERIELIVRGPLGEVVGRAVREDGRVVAVEGEDAPDALTQALIGAFTAPRERRRPSC